mgnify:CR=1 FL=1
MYEDISDSNPTAPRLDRREFFVTSIFAAGLFAAAVQPISAQTVVQDERPVTAFSIRAAFSKADSAYIRTVPLSQSVR